MSNELCPKCKKRYSHCHCDFWKKDCGCGFPLSHGHPKPHNNLIAVATVVEGVKHETM